MCPMCERRAQMLLRQQAVVEAAPASGKPSSTDTSAIPDKASLFRNPFRACKHLSRQCCSPHCESQRTSIASGRRSSVIAPVTSTPEHSCELTYIVSESPLSAESKDLGSVVPTPGYRPPLRRKGRKRKGLLTRLKLLTQTAEPKVRDEPDFGSTESSFGACGRKVTAVADELDQIAKAPTVFPSLATLLAAETDLEEDDSVSDVSIAVTETNVSETTILSMMNLNGSFSSPHDLTTSNRESTLKSSAYDDDASSFAIVPRTSIDSSYVGRDGASDASGLSDRFGELDIGYLSLEESGEGPEFDDTVSIASDQSEHEHLDLNIHDAQDDTVSESDLDSQEWVTETEDTASILQRSRTHQNRGTTSTTTNNLHRQSTPPPLPPPPSKDATPKTPKEPLSAAKSALVVKKSGTPHPSKSKIHTVKTLPPPLETPCTEYLCSRCGRKESGQERKNVSTKASPMSTFFKTFMGEEEQAVMAAKVVVLLGKYGNRKGLRVSGLSQQQQSMVSTRELTRMRSMISPKNDAVSAFQNEVARMMLEGVDVPELNVDVEQFIAGYMKLNSPFYIDLIQDFFKSVCVDCFGHMESVTEGVRRRPPLPRPAYAVLKPRKPKTIAGRTNLPRKLLQ